jgi:hypothetical protein
LESSQGSLRPGTASATAAEEKEEESKEKGKEEEEEEEEKGEAAAAAARSEAEEAPRSRVRRTSGPGRARTGGPQSKAPTRSASDAGSVSCRRKPCR